MKFFEELGAKVLERWRRADFEESRFPDIAMAALVERRPSEHVTPMDVIQWVVRAPSLPEQMDLPARFGNPPVEVFHCSRFYIQVLFWVDGSTAIHQHSFSGAFHVLEGSSLHSSHTFEETRRYSEALRLGRVELARAELLGKGDVRPIVPGAGFIHSLFHLDRPSVSVVIRTHGLPSASPQLSYSRAGIAFDPFHKPPELAKQLQMLELLSSLGHADFEPLLRECARDNDAFGAFEILTRLREHVTPHERYVDLLESVRPAHGEIVDVLVRNAEVMRREVHLKKSRRGVRDAGQRLFLALLLNVPERRPLLDLVHAAFPEKPAVETVLGWISDLAKLDALRAWAEEATREHQERSHAVLDMAIDDVALAELRELFLGRPVAPDARILTSTVIRPLTGG